MIKVALNGEENTWVKSGNTKMFETFGRADGKLSKKRQSGLSGTAVADTDCDEDDCESFFLKDSFTSVKDLKWNAA